MENDMKRFSYAGGILTVLTIISCVTINIYFPAEEIRGAADQIVDEVWGERMKEAPPTPPAQKENPGSSMLDLFGPSVAYAAQDIEVSTPEIRAIKASIKERSGELFPFLNSGNVGLGNDGLLKVRSTDGLDLKARGAVNRLVKAENNDRMRLYKEIAVANEFPEKAGEVQEIFAGSWRENAAAGWFVEDGKGAWRMK
jgi:uncharacterized protein YdbL (DUF1318 family)